MSLNRHAKSRDINEPPIVSALRAVGASVTSLDRPVDLLVGFQNRTILMEVKQPGVKRNGQPKFGLTPGQKDFLEEWRGGEAYTVHSVEQALLCWAIEQAL